MEVYTCIPAKSAKQLHARVGEVDAFIGVHTVAI
jgi:hypothetical protein